MSNAKYTYEEVAKTLNLKTAAAIYQKVQRNYDFYEPYIIKKNGKAGLNAEGLELIKTNAHKRAKYAKKANTKNTKSVKNASKDIELSNDRIKEYQETIKYLREQLSKAQDNLHREQELHHETKQELKLLKAGKPNNVVETKAEIKDEPQPEKKKGLWSKIWPKKN